MTALRTATLGLPLDYAEPAETAAQAQSFFAVLDERLAEADMDTRCRRYVAPPLSSVALSSPELSAAIAVQLEDALGERIWACLPGPAVSADRPAPEIAGASIEAMLLATRQVFSNFQVGHGDALDNRRIEAAAGVMRRLADRDPQANFRFAAMASVAPGTPFFPAAFHDGEPGFSLALELAEPFQQCVDGARDFTQRLAACREVLVSRVQQAWALAEAVEAETGVRFLGFDLSLAPYPGEGTSAVAIIEQLAGVRIGEFDFLFALYAMNDMLQHAVPGLPRVGFNGTMLSVLEDTRLAEATAAGEAGVKDLLLYATVCGCGLDMIPVAADVTAPQLASLSRAVGTIAQKWRKPLLARLLPSEVDATGRTRYQHDFLVNTHVMAVAGSVEPPLPCFGHFHPLRPAA